MKSILCVKKTDVEKNANVKPIPTESIIELFNNTDDLESIKQAVENAEERIYVTWASVDAVDKAGELIPIEDIIDKQDTLLNRNGPISDTHTNKIIGQTLAYKVMKNPTSSTIGVLHLDRIFNDYRLDDSVWEEIVSGERQGSSVGGQNTEMELEFDDNGKMIKVLKGFEHFETASVKSGCNPLALNESHSLVAKSDVSSSNVDINDNIDTNKTNSKGDDFMAEEKLDVAKSLNSLTEVVKTLVEKVEKLEKEDVPEEEEKKMKLRKKTLKQMLKVLMKAQQMTHPMKKIPTKRMFSKLS